jgi:hypothetical protein
MTTYTSVFGGANIYPSSVSYSAIALTADITLSWPEETSTSNNLATKIIDVTSSSVGLKIYLPDAAKAGNGETILFNNLGAFTFTVVDSTGVQVVTPTSGTLWQIYLTSNATAAGLWKTLQYGASLSNANASALAGTGIIAVGTLLSQSVPVTTFNTNYSSGEPDRAKMFNWTGAGGTITLPSAGAVNNNWFIYLRNSGTGGIVVTPSGVNTIDGLSSLNFQPGESAIIVSDGTNFYSIGFGQSTVFAFDYTSIAVAGTGNYPLTGTELNRIAYNFTGILTGNRSIIVPNTVQQYWVSNQTTGAYTLTVKTAAGTGIVVAAGARSILYCDGGNVVAADSAIALGVIPISQGGTGATTASAARINLGGTSVGISVFTAVDQAAAWSALGVAPSGVVNGGTF